jgi:glycosyltransferase involved in cell wall biosynthesis
LAAIQGTRAAICFVTHAREGGVLRQVEARAKAAEEDGFASLILSPRKDSQGQRYCDIRVPGCAFPNLRFSVDRDQDLFESFLQQRALAHIELHHFIGHDERLIQMMSRLEVPFDIHLHDYSWFCPRITLTYDNRYCGEPAVKVCEACVQDKGSSIEWGVSPRDLILWSQDLFTRARVVVAPTTDTAVRFERRFGIMPKVVAWEIDRRPAKLRPIPTIGQGRVRRICVAGAIGYEKGYEVILGCARYAAAHDLPVEFQIVGFTCDDARLIATRKVTVTGRYDESEAVSLIRQQESDFGFLPALWPETWSFVLSQLWEAGLPVVAFDIGAQSERIRSSGAGLVLPMNLPVDKLVHSLCRVSS